VHRRQHAPLAAMHRVAERVEPRRALGEADEQRRLRRREVARPLPEV